MNEGRHHEQAKLTVTLSSPVLRGEDSMQEQSLCARDCGRATVRGVDLRASGPSYDGATVRGDTPASGEGPPRE